MISVIFFQVQEAALQALVANIDGQYFLPAISLQEDEALEAVARRFAAKLLNTPRFHLQQLHTYREAGQPLRVVYLGVLPSDAKPSALEGYAWIKASELSQLVSEELIIGENAMRELHRRVEESSMVFSFLPAEFTLGELQKVWEILSGYALDKRNFRRRILNSGLIEPTSHQRTGQGRPAWIYRLSMSK